VQAHALAAPVRKRDGEGFLGLVAVRAFFELDRVVDVRLLAACRPAPSGGGARVGNRMALRPLGGVTRPRMLSCGSCGER
jgi:hypothetical protein